MLGSHSLGRSFVTRCLCFRLDSRYYNGDWENDRDDSHRCARDVGDLRNVHYGGPFGFLGPCSSRSLRCIAIQNRNRMVGDSHNRHGCISLWVQIARTTKSLLPFQKSLALDCQIVALGRTRRKILLNYRDYLLLIKLGEFFRVRDFVTRADRFSGRMKYAGRRRIPRENPSVNLSPQGCCRAKSRRLNVFHSRALRVISVHVNPFISLISSATQSPVVRIIGPGWL